MDGKQGFLKMVEIDRHLHREVEWWRGEGLDKVSIATVLRQVAESIDPPGRSWAEHWEATRPKKPRS